MTDKPEEIILEDNPGAAEYRTDIKGWVSRGGLYFGKDEYLARSSGSTHNKCSGCGAIKKKNESCRPCFVKREVEKFNALPKKKWDGEGMIYSMSNDKYFYEIESAEEFADVNGIEISDLMLVICEPDYGSTIAEDYFESSLPEDTSLEDVAPDLAAMIDEINEHIGSEKEILCWWPGEYAVEIQKKV